MFASSDNCGERSRIALENSLGTASVDLQFERLAVLGDARVLEGAVELGTYQDGGAGLDLEQQRRGEADAHERRPLPRRSVVGGYFEVQLIR